MSERQHTPAGSASPSALKEQAAWVFCFAAHDKEVRQLLAEIRAEAEKSKIFVLTEEEQKNVRTARDQFDADMKTMAFFTAENLKQYQLGGWMNLFDTEDRNDDHGTDSQSGR